MDQAISSATPVIALSASSVRLSTISTTRARAFPPHGEHGQIGIDPRDAGEAGERIGAGIDELALAGLCQAVLVAGCGPGLRRH
jgi:hypothetical protein